MVEMVGAEEAERVTGNGAHERAERAAAYREQARQAGRARQKGGPLPIVAVAGRWGKTTVARLLEAMVRRVAPRLALWTDQGVYVNGRRQAGELIPWGEALRALAAGELDLAVQELDATTVNAVGLPPATYALGIVTSFCGNDEGCMADWRAAGERQAQLAVARAIHPAGALVLNADDHAVADEGGATSGSVIYYGATRRNPFIKAHLAAGGRAVCISGGMIVLCEGRRSRPVLPVHDVALSLGGAIVFQVQNALAATAAAWRLGVPVATIAATLRDFTSSATLMPGACNQVQLAGATVIVDRLSDPYSARALARGLRRVKGRHRRVVLLPATGDEGLDPPALTEIGRVMGRSFDLIVIYSPEEAGSWPHGGPELELAASEAVEATEPTAFLRAGIALNPVPPVVLTVAGEGAALERVLRLLRPGDLALVLARDVALALRTVLTYRPVDAVETDARGEFLPTGGGPV